MILVCEKAFSESARASSLAARRAKRAAKLAEKEAGGSAHKKCTPVSQDIVGLRVAGERFLSASKDMWDDLTDLERASVKSYTDRGYKDINKALNGGGDLPSGLRKQVERLDAVLERSEVPEDLVLYRGISLKGITSKVPLKEGQEYSENGFLSTSSSKNMATEYSKDDRGVLEINVPKGSRGLYVGSVERSANAAEFEFVLPRDRLLKIRSVDRSSNPPKVVVLS